MKVKWSIYAEEQQADILRYLAIKMSLADAVRWAHRFHDDVERLADQPLMGHPVRACLFVRPPLLVERLREIQSGVYRIIYETVDEEIRILSLTHCSQMLEGERLVWDK